MPASSTGSEPTPPSSPSSAAELRGGRAALVLGACAVAACWNPLGAPVALVTGLGAAVLAVRALSRGAPRRVAAAALALGAGAAVASVVVLLAVAGVGVRPEEQLGVEPRPSVETERLLGEAEGRTREARERASRELEQLQDAPPKR